MEELVCAAVSKQVPIHLVAEAIEELVAEAHDRFSTKVEARVAEASPAYAKVGGISVAHQTTLANGTFQSGVVVSVVVSAPVEFAFDSAERADERGRHWWHDARSVASMAGLG